MPTNRERAQILVDGAAEAHEQILQERLEDRYSDIDNVQRQIDVYVTPLIAIGQVYATLALADEEDKKWEIVMPSRSTGTKVPEPVDPRTVKCTIEEPHENHTMHIDEYSVRWCPGIPVPSED